MDEVVLGFAPPEVTEVAQTEGEWSDPGDFAVEDVAPEVPEPVVRGLLASMGTILGRAVGDPDVHRHWRFTPDELEDLTPPLTRVINRRPALRAAVQRGDEAIVAVQLAGYLGRNIDDKRAAVKARREREGQHGFGTEGLGDVPPGAPGAVGFDGGFAGGGDAAGVPRTAGA